MIYLKNKKININWLEFCVNDEIFFLFVSGMYTTITTIYSDDERITW